MARIELPDPDRMTADERRQYDRFPANLTRALLATTGGAEPYLDLAVGLSKTSLSEMLRQGVIMRIAARTGSAYEAMQHRQAALDAGISEDQLAAIEANQPTGIARLDVLVGFADECARTFTASDATISALRALFTQQEICDAALFVGHYLLTAVFVRALDVDLDACPTSWSNLVP